MDKRHLRRLKIVQNLYSHLYHIPKKNNQNPTYQPITEILKNKEKLDRLISQFAEKIPPQKMAKVDLAILYQALWEYFKRKKIPVKVIIDEAVTLGRELGGEKSYALINAILGKVAKLPRNFDYEKS